MKRALMVILMLAGCLTGEHRDARDKYNEGVGALVKGDYEAAEKALLDARSGAGVDPELRFRAAYDLGMTYATHADKTKGGKDADLGKALEQEQEAISWFSDALRLRPTDADTIANLAVVRARAQAISDDLRKGENKLEARLDAVLKDQRGVLDEARGAWLAIKQGGGADPLAQQAALTKLADRERGIVAEVGTIGDLASDEIDAIGKKKEDKREPKEQVRMVQLKNLDLYLLDARARIAEARRKLQELAAQDGLARAEAAVAALKRAREQLLDPIAVLGEVARDEVQAVQETRSAAPAEHGLAGVTSAPPAAAAVPAWLEPGALAERQAGLRDRLEEVRARMAAGVDGADQRAAAQAAGSGAGSGEPPPKPMTPEEHKVIERVRAALPFIGTASSAMQRAQVAFTAAKSGDAIVAQTEALVALERAIEEFSDLKQVIELAYGHHEETLGYLSPDAAKELAPAERARKTLDAVTANRARMDRIKSLLADEQAQIDQQQAQLEAKLAQAGSGAGGGSAAPDGAAAKAQLAQAAKQLQTAEQLRAEAQTALAALDTALAKNTDPMPPAKDAEAKLAALRQLFFSVVEHLKELIRTQGETRDRTASEVTEDDVTRAPKLPALLTAQDQHLGMAKAITDALAKQADEASKQAAPQQGAGPTKPQQGPDPKALAGAADEVRKAQTDMGDAHAAIDKSQKATNVSVPLQPAVDSQAKALEHLEAALKLLEPPQKKNDQDKDQQKQDQQKQDQQKQDQQKQEQKPQPQGGAGQRARDDDARRQQRKGSASEPVDKDW